LIVADALADQRFADNPLVTGAPHIRFYAGMPIEPEPGVRIGTLCVIDSRPRHLDERQIRILRNAGAALSRELAMRYAKSRAEDSLRRSESAVLEREELFRSAFELAPVGVAIVAPEGRFVRVNAALCAMVGYPAEELMSLSFQQITHPDDLDADLELLSQLVSGEIPHYRLEKRYITSGGAQIWINLTVSQQATEDGPNFFIAIIEDINERKQSAEQIISLTANLEQQVIARTEQLNRVIELAELRNQQLRTLGHATAMLTAARSTGEVSEVIQLYLPQVFAQTCGALHLSDAGMFQPIAIWGDEACTAPSLAWHDCWALRRGEEHRVDKAPQRLRCHHVAHDDAMFHTCIPIFAKGQAVGMLEVHWPVALNASVAPDPLLLSTLTRKLGLALTNIRLRDELRSQALHDPLTGLYNRHFLAECIKDRLAGHARGGKGFAIVMLDIDHFKSINDTHGHDFGDRVIREVAALLQCVTRNDEAAFRYGGEEFLMVIDCDDALDARRSAERLRASVRSLQLRNPANPDGPPVSLSVSVGFACCPPHGTSMAELISGADQALYAAKLAGRDRVNEATMVTPRPAAEAAPVPAPRRHHC